MISKRTCLQVHRWSGLILGAYVLFQAVTGCLLVFRDRLAQLIDPGGLVRHSASGTAPMRAVIASAQAAEPGYAVTRVVWPVFPNGTYFLHLVGQAGALRYASVDPGDAHVLARGDIWRFPLEAVLLLHEMLNAGTAGVVAVIVLGLVILTMIVTGLVFWWPRSGRWGQSLRIDLKRPPRLGLRQAHRSLAVVASPIVGLIAVTGILLALALIVDRAPGFVASAGRGQPAAASAVDRGLALALSRFAPRGVRDVRLPASHQMDVYVWAPERNATAVSVVGIDLLAGRIDGVRPARDDPGLWVTPLPLHTGEALGLAGQLIIFLGGLALASLAMSGLVVGLWRWRR